MINLKRIDLKNKHHVQYLDVPSSIRPPHNDFPVPKPDDNIEYSPDSVVARDDAYKPEGDNQPLSLTLVELNDLTRDLNLSKESAQLLG